jgi:hypothetical protein
MKAEVRPFDLPQAQDLWVLVLNKCMGVSPQLMLHITDTSVVDAGRFAWTVRLSNSVSYEMMLDPDRRNKLRAVMESMGLEGIDIVYEIGRAQREELVHRGTVADLRGLSYEDYLRSDHWNAKRVGALGRARFKCQMCGASGRELQVHHNTYERLGEELDSDLIALCGVCHGKHHDKYGGPS